VCENNGQNELPECVEAKAGLTGESVWERRPAGSAKVCGNDGQPDLQKCVETMAGLTGKTREE